MNDPNPQIEQILATLATKEELKALEARLAKLEAYMAPPSAEERSASERRLAATHPEFMEMLERGRRRRLRPGYAERMAEAQRILREAGLDD